MPILQFMPWCPIDKTYFVGDITIIPFCRDETIEGVDKSTTCQILASYKDLEGKPVGKAALVLYGNRPLLADLSDDELDITDECVTLACFCGLAKREYFNQLGPYCNADCFTLYRQKFDSLDFVSIISRRREGRTQEGRPLRKTCFSIPVHVSPVERVTLDEKLLQALVALRQSSSDDEWSRWQNAISCFNWANTDNDAIHYQVEWVLLCSAFEHILEAEPKAEDVAKRFTDALIPSTSLSVRAKRHATQKQRDPNKPLRYEWMKEFYRIRGDFAHGRLKTRQPAMWNPREHIVLATIVFPLLVRCLLSRRKHYELTEEDRAQVNAFEKLADEQFLKPPQNQKSSIDSVWSRLRSDEESKLRWQGLEQELMNCHSKPGRT